MISRMHNLFLKRETAIAVFFVSCLVHCPPCLAAKEDKGSKTETRETRETREHWKTGKTLTQVHTVTTLRASDKTMAATDKQIDCILIEQEDTNIGKLKLYLGKDHVRLDGMNGLLHVVSSAPTWNVYAWNHDKQSFNLTKEEWYRDGMETIVMTKRHMFGDPNNPPQKVTFMGMPAVKNSRVSHGGNGYVGTMFRTDSAKTKELTRVTYIATDHLKLSSGAASFCQGLFLTTPNSTVVLEAQSKPIGKPVQITLKTKSITNVKKPLSYFQAPRVGLKPAPSLAALIAGKGIEEMMLNFSGSN